MKILVRKSVFETNSSSSHSIAIADEDHEFVFETIYPDQNGVIEVHTQEFGWEWEKYNDSMTKLAYAYQDNVPVELLIKVVKEQTGAEKVIFNEEQFSYIDHQSYGTVGGRIKTEEDIRNFVFNKNSWLFTGNDNSTADPMFYHVPEIKDGKMIKPEYRYELTIEGLEGKFTKYLRKPSDNEIDDGIHSLLRDTLMHESGGFFVVNSIEFDIMRSRDFFELSWSIEQDFSSGFILMTKEGNEIHKFEDSLKESGKITDKMRWDEKGKILYQELLDQPKIAKKVPFHLKKI